ncbi:MAG: CPBP family intramembrane glutamic endopeptidase [Ilumatobacteraceae bacterium]
MTVSAIIVLAATFVGWAYIFVLPRPGIWVRSWTAAGVLVSGSAAALWRAGELGDAVGTTTIRAVLVGLGAGAAWVIITQIGHQILCRLLPSFIERVRDLYSIATGDRRVDVAIALVAMAVAEEFVFRLVVQREFGIIAGIVAYAAVQAVERNWALMLAGALCGAVWGVLYAWQDNLAAPLVAHVIWTGTLTFFWPLRGCDGNRVPEAAGIAMTDV